MKKNIGNNYYILKKASIVDLKKDGIVKSVEVYTNEYGSYVAKIVDSFSTTIEVLIGSKSVDLILSKGELSESLENSAFIVLIDEEEEELRFTTNLYTQARHIFNTSPSLNEQKDILEIKTILIKKGLSI